MKIQFLFMTFLFSIIHLALFAQNDHRVLSPKKMKKDLNVLLENMEAHPDPYSKISESDFRSLIKEVENNIATEIDEIDFLNNLSRIVAAVGDGHTRLMMNFDWLKEQRKKNGAFPYKMFLTNDEELFVIESYGDYRIPVGSQVLEINGMTIADFVETVTPYISHEVKLFRNDAISESFEMLLYQVFKTTNQLKIKYKGGDEAGVVIPTIKFKDWKNEKEDLKEERESKIKKGIPYDFEILKPGVAKIDIFSFSVKDIDYFKNFLRKTFKSIDKENVHSLIIDVRGNYGGWPKVSSELFHYIHEGHFKVMAKSSLKVSKPYRRFFTDSILPCYQATMYSQKEDIF